MRPLFPVLLTACLLAAAPVAPPARAAEAAAAVENVSAEAAFVLDVEGEVAVDDRGTLTDLRFDTPLADEVRTKLEARVRGWRFQPASVGVVVVPSRSPMRLTLVANKDGDTVRVRVENVVFRPDPALAAAPGASRGPRTDKLSPPRYPSKVLRVGTANARVLLAIRVGVDGRAADVAVVQSGFYDQAGAASQLLPYLREFERSALRAAQNWTFMPPANAATASASEMTVLIPVGYGGSGGFRKAKPGEWRRVVRTVRQPPAWLSATDDAQAVGIDGLADGESLALAGTVRLADASERGREL